jgi:hypothetical protein
LRALKRDREAADIFDAVAREASAITGDKVELLEANNEFESEAAARITVGRLATLAGAAALQASAPSEITETFLRTRLSKAHGALYGASGIDARSGELVLQRALPEN